MEGEMSNDTARATQVRASSPDCTNTTGPSASVEDPLVRILREKTQETYDRQREIRARVREIYEKRPSLVG